MTINQKIGILDLGFGNLGNIIKVINYFNNKVVLVKNKNDFNLIDKLILPGVGSFNHFCSNVKKNNLDENILEHLQKNKFLLGVCLGMQVLSNKSFENGLNYGLKIIKKDVINLKDLDNKIITPNYGWYKLKKKKDLNFFNKFIDKKFYFAHSYFCKSIDKNTGVYIDISKNDVPAGFEQEYIIGTQFHPELSGENGLEFYNSFFNL